MARLRPDEVRRMRAAAQGLLAAGGDAAEGAAGAGAGAGTVLDAVRRSAGLQAQDIRACRLQVRARTSGLTAADVDAACAAGAAARPGAAGGAQGGPDSGTGKGGPRAVRDEPGAAGAGAADGAGHAAAVVPAVVRTWLMRGTLHAVEARDVRWLTALLGPRVADGYRGRRQRLGLDDDVCARGLTALERVLAGRALERDALVARLAEHGVPLDPRSQAPAHLLLYAATRGLVCRGPDAPGDTPTYVLTGEWLEGVPDAGLTGDAALAEIAVRHAAAYGPVTAADLARWSGLPLGQARRGQAAAGERLAEVAGPDGPSVTAADAGAPPPATGQVRLTGHFDPYLLGYRDRDLLLPPVHARRIATGGGFLMPCVLRDGAVVGTWRHERRGGGLDIRVETFSGARPGVLSAGLDAEVRDIARFLGVPAAWHWAPVAP